MIPKNWSNYFVIALVQIPFALSKLAAQTTGYVADEGNSQLLTVDLTTAEVHVVGPFQSVEIIGGLAYDSKRNKLLGVSPDAEALCLLNVNTGEAHPIGTFGLENVVMQGGAYDPFTDTVFGSAATRLYAIDPVLGSARLVGSFGEGIWISGLAVDPVNGDLYGSSPAQSPGQLGLFRVNKFSAAVTQIGSLAVGYNGLAFDSSGTLYGIQNDTNGLFRISTADASSVLIGQLAVEGINPLGFEIVSVPEPASSSMVLLVGVLLGLKRSRAE